MGRLAHAWTNRSQEHNFPRAARMLLARNLSVTY
jgi:hypothetical protein